MNNSIAFSFLWSNTHSLLNQLQAFREVTVINFYLNSIVLKTYSYNMKKNKENNI